MLSGDLTFTIGTVAVILYIIFSLCISAVRYTAKTGKMGEQNRRYDSEIGRLQGRIEELKEERAGISPKLDELVGRVLELRSRRDKLQMGYQEMQDKVRTRQLDIKSKG
jgi:predicted nuclease with TOPRIM domain